jgi:putrescine aminotransferase
MQGAAPRVKAWTNPSVAPGSATRRADEREAPTPELAAGSLSGFLGRAAAEVASAIAAELRDMPGATRVLFNATQAQAVEDLVCHVGAPFTRAMLLSSGGEAIDAALKLARASVGRDLIFCLDRAYHGHFLGAASISQTPGSHADPMARLTSVRRFSPENPALVARAILAERPACVVLESLQVEAGVRPLSETLLWEVSNACWRSGAVLIADESRSGLGRTGTEWSYDRSGITPDIVIVAEPLGAGLVPVAALLAREEVYAPYNRDPFLHTSTFGGAPLAAAALRATLDVMRVRNTASASARLGHRLTSVCEAVANTFPEAVVTWNGRGLIHGLTFRNPGLAGSVADTARVLGLAVSPCRIAPETLRMTPPYDWTEQDLARFSDLLSEAIERHRPNLRRKSAGGVRLPLSS